MDGRSPHVRNLLIVSLQSEFFTGYSQTSNPLQRAPGTRDSFSQPVFVPLFGLHGFRRHLSPNDKNPTSQRELFNHSVQLKLGLKDSRGYAARRDWANGPNSVFMYVMRSFNAPGNLKPKKVYHPHENFNEFVPSQKRCPFFISEAGSFSTKNH